MIPFQITALYYSLFAGLFRLDNSALEKAGAIKMIADKQPGFPCRVSLQDAAPGEEVILLTFRHHDTNSPYRASGAIFIRKNATTAQLGINEIPVMLEGRLLSIRAYDKSGMMKAAFVCEGTELRAIIQKSFTVPRVNYAHIHNAKQGCYHCKVNRVEGME